MRKPGWDAAPPVPPSPELGKLEAAHICIGFCQSSVEARRVASLRVLEKPCYSALLTNVPLVAGTIHELPDLLPGPVAIRWSRVETEL